jgi:solute carrier family 25 phosphate transporter 3
MVHQEGMRSLFYGLSPTAAGYAIQGACKFGFFEFFKAQFFRSVPSLRKHHLSVYLASSMMAETIASCFLSPFEAIRIRMVSQPAYGRGMLGVGRRMVSSEGLRSLYRGLPPLLAKQVPYTTVQLSVFSLLMDNVYHWLGWRKQEHSLAGQLGVTVGCGVVAGVLSSLASHPADTVLSRINVALKQGQAAPKPMDIVRQLGFKRLWLGVGTRCIFTGVLSAGIFLVNDSVRLAVGMQTSGKS